MEASTLPLGSAALVGGVRKGFDAFFSRKMDVDQERDSR